MAAFPTGLGRRRFLAAGTAGFAGLLAGPSRPAGPAPAPEPPDLLSPYGEQQAGIVRPTSAQPDVLSPYGEQQAGIVRPAPAQPHCTVTVCDLPDDGVFGLLARLTGRIERLTAGTDPALGGLAPAALTITVGLGPRAVAAIGPGVPGTTELPVFARERIEPEHRGGDLFLQVCATDPLVVALATTALETAAGRRRWQAHGFRGAPLPGSGAARNLLGFADGLAGPRTEAELRENVWLDGRAAGATIAVVRRITLDVEAFLALPRARQEAVFGRRRDVPEPLSGGGPDADIDLGAKTPDGEYLVPADAHVRVAHPLTSGTGLMLRRSYSTPDGLLFISFQRELRTFTATQASMDERDALLRFTTVTATGTFLVLPGFSPGEALGERLRPPKTR